MDSLGNGKAPRWSTLRDHVADLIYGLGAKVQVDGDGKFKALTLHDRAIGMVLADPPDRPAAVIFFWLDDFPDSADTGDILEAITGQRHGETVVPWVGEADPTKFAGRTW